jgi:broad specificity phosphatase PhoE
MFEHPPRLILVPHADAGDRMKWTTDQDLRPLSDLGVSQAAALAIEIGAVDAIISSPARRCTETVAPVAARSAVEIELNEDLREITFVSEIEGWDGWDLDPTWRAQLVASAAVGRALRVLESVRSYAGASRVVLSAHGDLIPLLTMFAAGYFRVPAPPPVARGGCYVIDRSNPARPISTLGALMSPPS